MLDGPRPSPCPSWWLDNLSETAAPAPLAHLPTSAEVVIIGSGMTGSAVAYWLRRLYNRVCLVLDARGVAGGATGRNGGHLLARPQSAFERETVDELLQFIEREGVECDLVRTGTVVLERRVEPDAVFHDGEGDPEDVDGEEWGGAGVGLWDKAECKKQLHTEAFVAGTHYPEGAQFYPAKVAAALLRHSRASLAAPVRVSAIETVDGKPRVHTDAGEVQAEVVVVATNGWTATLLPELAPHLRATRNQVIMTSPLPGGDEWGVGGISVDDGAREIYAIRRPDGRVCVGGARAIESGAAVGNDDDSSLCPSVGKYLRAFLTEHFPALGFTGDAHVEREWTGVLGFTSDGYPICGALPSRPGVLVGAGFCGHGMPQCFGVGKYLAMMSEGLLQNGENHTQRTSLSQIHPYILGPANSKRFFVKD
ncbi:hypothetical protein AB1Y20_019038 [Prymnesium parvum]|uniref:FAD dependent oxidoreductase domain-containing protein n=1 Tax=Prymnesium parvum TaxID=97485 RepID=A0AB34JPW9_PRYPA